MIQESPDIGTKVLLRLCYSTLFPLPHFPWGHHNLFECKSLPVVCFRVIQPRHGFSEPEINAHVKQQVLAYFHYCYHPGVPGLEWTAKVFSFSPGLAV